MSPETVKEEVLNAAPLPKKKVVEKKAEKPVAPPPVPETKPLTIVTELDSYISEKMKTQPLAKDIKVIDQTDEYRHRLSLPPHFEAFSRDCSIGRSCKNHHWKPFEVQIAENQKITRWAYEVNGKYVFRWILKDKRSIDRATTVRGWVLVNRQNFPDAPRELFSVNGGVEVGDNILAFLPAEIAKKYREDPGIKSRERIDAELNKHRENPNYYEAKLDSEEVSGADDAPLGSIQEGRDFNQSETKEEF